MIFTSLVYLIFLILTATFYYLIPGRFRWVWLLFASIAYYVSFIPVFIIPLACLIIINYFLSIRMSAAEGKPRNSLFLLTIVLNLFILIFFKYFGNIFPGNHTHLYRVDLFFRTDPVESLIMPLGLSYIIFTILAYQIELKRSTIKPETHPGYFSLFILFFPKIAQGPVERPAKLLSQVSAPNAFDYGMITDGLKTILWGYFKKLVVADRLAIYVNAIYGNSEHHSGISLAVATVFFAFQIYADFSGYTDIAIGSAKIFGINLSENFRQPYLATSIKDFWDRWHITFSSWLRDYIYTPMAVRLTSVMSREKYLAVPSGKWIYFISIMVTFAICGIWHGVGTTYLAWGLLFGIYLTFSNWSKDFNKRMRKRFGISNHSWPYMVYKTCLTFLLVLAGWIIFRAESIEQAVQILTGIFTVPGSLFYEKPSDLIFSVFGIAALVLMDLKQEYFRDRLPVMKSRYSPVRIAGITMIVITILLAAVFDGSQFIYFQF